MREDIIAIVHENDTKDQYKIQITECCPNSIGL